MGVLPASNDLEIALSRAALFAFYVYTSHSGVQTVLTGRLSRADASNFLHTQASAAPCANPKDGSLPCADTPRKPAVLVLSRPPLTVAAVNRGLAMLGRSAIAPRTRTPCRPSQPLSLWPGGGLLIKRMGSPNPTYCVSRGGNTASWCLMGTLRGRLPSPFRGSRVSTM
jgi:hypothetical protein